MCERIRILIVDDQPRARQSLKVLLSTWPHAKEIQEASSGQEAVCLIEESQPDIVLMDVQMPQMNGLAATRLIKTRWPRVQVIMLSLYAEYLDDAVVAGADGFFIKGEPPERLLATLTAVATGG